MNELLAGLQNVQKGTPNLTNGLDQLNSKVQEGSEKAAKAEKIINALDLTKLETAVNNLEKSETAMKEFKNS